MKHRLLWPAIVLCAASIALPAPSVAEQGKSGKAQRAQSKATKPDKVKGTSGTVVNPQMRYKAMDANNDGVIQRDEWRGAAEAFAQRDWNGDGELSGEEVRPGAARPVKPKGKT